MILSHEHKELYRQVRSFVDKELNPNILEWEKAGIWPAHEVLKKMGQLGFLGISKPEAYGGQGADILFSVALMEEQVRTGVVGPMLSLHNDVVAPYLLRLANEEQKQRWLPQFCTGELITAIAMTEPGTGSDLQGIKTRAVRQGDHYILNGSKTFITNGVNADLVIVDCPSPERSQSAMTIAPFMDQTLMVVAADEPDVRAPAGLRDAIAAAGGNVSGLFFNRVTVEQPGFLRALLP